VELSKVYSLSLDNIFQRAKGYYRAFDPRISMHSKYNYGVVSEEGKLRLFALQLSPRRTPFSLLPAASSIYSCKQDFFGPKSGPVDSFIYSRQRYSWSEGPDPLVMEIIKHDAVTHADSLLAAFPCAPPIGDSVVLFPQRMSTAADKSVTVLLLLSMPPDPLLENWYAVVPADYKMDGEMTLRQCIDVVPLNGGSWLVVRDEGKLLIHLNDIQEKQRWPMTLQVKKIVTTPFRSMRDDPAALKSALPVILFVTKSPSSPLREVLLFSANKLVNMPTNDLKQPRNVEGATLELNEGEMTENITWQSLGEGQAETTLLVGILTNQRLIIADYNLNIVNAIATYRGDNRGYITSFLWLSNVIIFTTSNMQMEYMTCLSPVSRLLCSLDQGSVSSARLVFVGNDRVVYCATFKSGQTTILTRPLQPLEPLVIGALEAHTGVNGEELKQLVFRYAARFTAPTNNEGLIPDAGVSVAVIAALSSSGYADLAYFIAKSSDNQSIFLQRPQIHPRIKSLLAVNLKMWDDAISELLADDPNVLEYAKNPDGLGSTLPPNRSVIAHSLNRLAVMALTCGNLDFTRRCLDISGNDWEMISLLSSIGTKGASLLQKFVGRIKVPNPVLHLVGLLAMSKTAAGADTYSNAILSLPKRRGSLLKVGPSEVLPPYAVEIPPVSIPNINARPASIENTMKPLALESVHAWVGVPRPLAANLKQQATASLDGGIESMIAAATSAGPSNNTGGGANLTRLEGEEAVMGYWRFEEEEDKHADMKVLDLSKSAIVGSLLGDAKYVESECPCDQGDPKKVSKQWAAQLSGNGACSFQVPVVKGENLDIGFHQSGERNCFTVELWVKIAASKAPVTIVTRTNETGRQWELKKVDSSLVFSTIADKEKPVKSEAGTLPDDVWCHVACTLDGSENKVSLYINGNAVGEGVVSQPTNSMEGPSEMVFGPQMKGEVTEVRVWCIPRRSNEIYDFYATHLDLAMKKKIKVTIHPRDCTCEKCSARKNATAAKTDFGGFGLEDPSSESSGATKKGRRVTKDKKGDDAASLDPPAEASPSRLDEPDSGTKKKKGESKTEKKSKKRKDEESTPTKAGDIKLDIISEEGGGEDTGTKSIESPKKVDGTPIKTTSADTATSPQSPSLSSAGITTTPVSSPTFPVKDISGTVTTPEASPRYKEGEKTDPTELVQVALGFFQKGLFGDSLKAFNKTLEMLVLPPREQTTAVKAQIAFCIKYKLALHMLEAIKLRKSPYSATPVSDELCCTLCKRLVALPLQPPHRTICTKIAADVTMKIGNYGHAADILEAFISDPAAKKMYDSCSVEHGKKNTCSLEASCPKCKVVCKATDVKCLACGVDFRYCYKSHALISATHFTQCTVCSTLYSPSVVTRGDQCVYCLSPPGTIVEKGKST
jgi:hypothetical protein